MNGISLYFNNFTSYVGSIPFDTLALIDLCAFLGVFVLTLFGCLCSRKIRYADKRAFFHLLNAFTAVTFALFCTRYSATKSIVAAALFWCAGYLLYGLLCALSKKPVEEPQVTGTPLPVILPQPAIKNAVPNAAPAAQSVVRLDHALSIADKLLLKTLGRGDRQELEKIKTSLTVLKVKGELSPQDGEALNEAFNALLKLMAKYDM